MPHAIEAKDLPLESWPTLVESKDFIPTTEDHKIKFKWSPELKLTPEFTRKKIFDSFYFFSDFASETRGQRPREWIDSEKHPQKALEAGYPNFIPRPKNDFYFPIYPMIKLSYFKGDDVVNAEVNVCQTYWVQKQYQEAYNCFATLQMNLSKSNYPSTEFVKMQVNILQGFFMLHVLMNNIDVKNISFNANPPINIRFKPGEISDITKSIFYYIATHYDEKLYLPEKISNDIMKNYGDFYNFPYYLIKDKFVSEKEYETSFGNESVDMMTWMRSIMPMVYMNVIGLSNNSENWQRGFNVIDRIGKYVDSFVFPEQPKETAFRIPFPATVGEDIFLKPVNNIDMLMVTDLYRALALQSSKDPDSALKHLAAGILRKGDPNLASLLFKVSGDGYYDLDILQLSRRSYSWSELYSKEFVDKIPGALFFGAESAFWLGHYDTAKKGFKRFLLASSDPKYTPYARLRLGNIAQVQGDDKSAKTMFEYIVRNFEKHPAAQDATVNIFCMDIHSMSKNVRKNEYKNVTEKIQQTRTDLQRQAKACLLKSDLIDATELAAKEEKKNVVQKSKIQEDLIENYKKEFPENEFIILFAERIKQLNLAQASLFSSQNKCQELIEFYKKNKNELTHLSKDNNKYVKGLRWSKVERLKLLRCSALLQDNEIWKEARSFDVGKDKDPLQSKFYTLAVHPSSHAAIELYFELKKSIDKWKQKLERIERSGTEMTIRSDFWDLLAIRKFLNYEFTASSLNKKLISNVLVKDIMKSPKMIFQTPLFCSWFLKEFDSLSSEDLDLVSNLKNSVEWSEILDNPENKNKCDFQVARNLVAKSLKIPSDVRDRNILLPYLEKQGFELASEDWLSYAQRLEQEKGSKDPYVVDIYNNLIKNTKDELIKKDALLWMKKNFPKSTDKVLW